MSKAEGFPPKAVRLDLVGPPNASPVARGALHATGGTEPKVFLSPRNAFCAEPKVFFVNNNPFRAEPKVFLTSKDPLRVDTVCISQV